LKPQSRKPVALIVAVMEWPAW